MRIDTSYVCLKFPAGNGQEALAPFSHKWRQLQEGEDVRINVLHLGGSHVQAGTLSGTVRSHLMPLADRGLLFPFRAIRTNGPADVRYEYTGLWRGSRCVSQSPDGELGLSGAAAITCDSTARLTLIMRNDSIQPFRQLVVLGQASDATVAPYVLTMAGDTLQADSILSRIADVEGTWVFTLPQADTTATVCFTGLTAHVPPTLKRAQYLPMEAEHWFALRGLLPQSGKPGVTYTECGINGAAVPSWLRTSRHFEQELSLLPPDLVVMGIGINDANVPKADFDTASFKRDYRELIRRIRTVSPHAALVFITNNDCLLAVPRHKRVPNPNTALACEAFYALAREEGAAVFDVYHLMGGQKSSAAWMAAGMMKRDRIHFTLEGYQLVGHMLAEALLKAVKE